MDKELIEAFVLECKQEQEFQIRWNAAHIKFENYFKYSGEIEEVKKEKNFKKVKDASVKIVTNDPVVQFYFDTLGYTLKEIAQVFKIQESNVSGRLDKYFKENKKK
jgi:hypothetical protein